VASVFTFACAFTTNVPAVIAINVVLGFGVGLFWPSLIAWIGEGLSGPALSKRLARFSVAWNTGLLLGFGVTGYVFKRWGPDTPFLIAGGAVVAIILILSLPIPPSIPATAPTTEAATVPTVPKGRGFRKTSWLANFGMTFTFFGITALFPQLATHLGIDAGVHGVLLALWRLGAFVMFLVLPHFHFWQTRLWPVWVAQAVSVAAVVGFAFASHIWLFGLALFVGGLMLGFNYQASIFFTLTEMTEKGKGSGVHEATLGAGMFFGPILAGVVGDRFSLRTPYFFCAGFLLAWIALQMAIVAWRRRRPAL
jgi:MFS family permease